MTTPEAMTGQAMVTTGALAIVVGQVLDGFFEDPTGNDADRILAMVIDIVEALGEFQITRTVRRG